jgi:hypothetical protein
MKSLFLDHNSFSFSSKLNLLCERYEEILNEYKSVEDKLEFKDFTNEQNCYISERKRGYPITFQSYFSASERKKGVNGWHVAAISANSNLYIRNSIFLPTLVNTINEIGNICVCAVNILDPGTQLDWHSDDEYISSENSFRCLWVLDSPEKDCIMQLRNSKSGKIETINFQNNKIYSFYHFMTHRVENLADKPRIVVAIDINGINSKYHT